MMVNVYGVRGGNGRSKNVGMPFIKKWLNNEKNKHLGYKLEKKSDGVRKSKTYGLRYWVVEKVQITQDDNVDTTDLQESDFYMYERKFNEDGSFELIRTNLINKSDGKVASLKAFEEQIKIANKSGFLVEETLKDYYNRLPNGWAWKVEEQEKSFTGAVAVKYRNKMKTVCAVVDGKITVVHLFAGTSFKDPNVGIEHLKKHKDKYNIEILEVEV